MTANKNVIKATFGPSLMFENKSAYFDYDESLFGGDLSITKERLAHISSLLPNVILEKMSLENINSVNDLFPKLITALNDSGLPLDHKVGVIELGEGKYRVYSEYYNRRRVFAVINAAGLVINTSNLPDGALRNQMVTKIKNVISYINQWAVGNIVQGFLLKAKARNLPINLLVGESHYYSFGQGKNARIFNFALTEFDSFLGHSIQKSKSLTNELLLKTGYPTSVQKIISTPQMCVEAANKIGFPVVIKPLSEGSGRGVTANIMNNEHLLTAFAEANKFSPGKILLEKHVDGDVHRITVSQGKVMGLGIRYRAQVIGDGKSNVKELIEKENLRRKEPELAALKIKQIVYDERLKKNLSNANCTLESVPEKGKIILLGDIANRSVGGTLEMLNIEDMHPDYIELASDISRIFMIDSIGIDVISPDISKSWREVGVIIELNCFPMAAPDLADKFLENHFGEGEGRIDTTLVVSSDHKMAREIFKAKQKDFEKPGLATNENAEFGSGPLMTREGELGDHCLALVLNKNCDAIVASITAEELLESGLPLDRFDHCVIDKNIDLDDIVTKTTEHKSLKEWMLQYCDSVEIK